MGRVDGGHAWGRDRVRVRSSAQLVAAIQLQGTGAQPQDNAGIRPIRSHRVSMNASVHPDLPPLGPVVPCTSDADRGLTFHPLSDGDNARFNGPCRGQYNVCFIVFHVNFNSVPCFLLLL